MDKKYLVAMSGGVDSSVAALIVKNSGIEPVGITMRLYDNERAGMCDTKTCCSMKDTDDARAVAAKLDFPYYVVNFTEGFKEKVIDKFVQTYIDGATPNPCIDCNRYMKFGALLERAKQYDCEKIVTGHYARVVFDENLGEWCLLKAKDPSNASLYYVEGNINKELGNIEEAAKCYAQCSSVDPNYEFGYIGAGVMYYDYAVELQEKARLREQCGRSAGKA